MVSVSESWRANAFRSASSIEVAEERQAWRKPSLRNVATVLAILAAPIVLGFVGWILSAATRVL